MSQYRMKPISGACKPTDHLVIHCERETRRKSETSADVLCRAAWCRAWKLYSCEDSLIADAGREYSDTDGLLALILGERRSKGPLTIWLARGWEDLVGSRLAELIDTGIMTWRFATIDGAKVLIRGAVRGAAVNITSLANWTGGAWDAWRDYVLLSDDVLCSIRIGDVPRDSQRAITADEACVLRTVGACLAGARYLRSGAMRLSAAQQARGWWRAWLGPRVTLPASAAEKKDKAGRKKDCVWVAPLPSRPDAARLAERQVASGMVHEQYASGHHPRPVHVWDMRAAYLGAITHCAIPTVYLRRRLQPSIHQLREDLESEVAVALVRIKDPITPYIIRSNGRAVRAIGHYWTWLTGAELTQALEVGHARECHVSWHWSSSVMDPVAAGEIFGHVTRDLRGTAPYLVPYLRTQYSALVGSFAGWSRQWVDSPHPAVTGRWGAWTGRDPKSGEITRYRAIAGRVQQRVDSGDAPGSCPILYGCALAWCRAAMDALRGRLPLGTVLAMSADSLWLTEDGDGCIRAILAEHGAVDPALKAADIYDQVWMDGRGRSAVSIGGKIYPMVAGIPTWAELGPDGKSRWMAHSPWTETQRPDARRGTKLHPAAYSLDRLIKDNSYPLIWDTPWKRMVGGRMREELLTPLARTVLEDQDDARD